MFISKHYLLVTFLVSLIIAIAVATFLASAHRESSDAAAQETDVAVKLSILFTAIGLLTTWPRWLLTKLNATVRKAVDALGGPNDKSDIDFEERVGSVFGKELVSNIYAYETYCKNEYILDMQKHHLAWLMLAVAGAITVGAALFVLFAPVGSDLKWVEAVGVTLPALVTSILLKIWLETRENLKKTRERTDTIYRQRIRLLLLVADHVGKSNSKWADSIALNRQLLHYIGVPDLAEERGD